MKFILQKIILESGGVATVLSSIGADIKQVGTSVIVVVAGNFIILPVVKVATKHLKKRLKKYPKAVEFIIECENEIKSSVEKGIEQKEEKDDDCENRKSKLE